jgi:hypothetical protein
LLGERFDDVPGFYWQAPARYPQRVAEAERETFPPCARVAPEVPAGCPRMQLSWLSLLWWWRGW